MSRLIPRKGNPAREAVGRVAAGGAIATQVGMVMALVLAMAVGWLGSPELAAAQTANPPPQSWTVQVGADDPPTVNGPLEIEAYGPDPLIIRVGDTVSWKWA